MQKLNNFINDCRKILKENQHIKIQTELIITKDILVVTIEKIKVISTDINERVGGEIIGKIP